MIKIPHLETNITVACQLSCVACNHLVPLWRSSKDVWKADPHQVEQDMNHLSSFLHADVWGALGGEPLLHSNLVDILNIVRSSSIADKLEVWTNGIALSKYKHKSAFWKAFDTLVLSIYAGKLTDTDISNISSMCADNGIELVIKDERTWHNFRTLLEPHPTNDQETLSKYRGCFFRSFSRVADRGYFFTCCCAPHMPALLQNRQFGDDGIKIDGSTESSIRAYLDRELPLGCCNICAGRDTAKPLDWKEEKDPSKWLEASKGKLDVIGIPLDSSHGKATVSEKEIR